MQKSRSRRISSIALSLQDADKVLKVCWRHRKTFALPSPI